jgi:hypothetical protein
VPDKNTEICALCHRDIPADEMEAHQQAHAQTGQVYVDVKQGQARPVYVEGIGPEDVIDILSIVGIRAVERGKLIDLAAASVVAAGGSLDRDGRYPASAELAALVTRLLGLGA